MGTSATRAKAKYNSENYVQFNIRIKPELLEKIRAKKGEMSYSELLNNALDALDFAKIDEQKKEVAELKKKLEEAKKNWSGWCKEAKKLKKENEESITTKIAKKVVGNDELQARLALKEKELQEKRQQLDEAHDQIGRLKARLEAVSKDSQPRKKKNVAVSSR